MYRSPLKVHGEYLIGDKDGVQAAANMPGNQIIRAGKSLSGLEIVVCANGTAADPEAAFSLEVGACLTISVKHSQDAETFIALPPWEAGIAAPEDAPTALSVEFRPGDIIARMTLPYDCLPYIKGDLAFSAPPAGKLSMFPACLPR